MPGGPDKLSVSPLYTVGLLFQAPFDTEEFLPAKECGQSFGVHCNETQPVLLGSV